MTNRLRFGVLGTARITRRLVAEMQSIDALDVTAIASREQSRATWYANQYGIPNAFASYQQLLESDLVDAVYIPLPPSLHLDWALKSAEHGKHVLVEKPVALSGDEVQQLDQACAEHKVGWLDATGWLFHPRTARMLEIIRGGELGQIKHISVACSFYEPFQSEEHRLDRALGGGCLLDLGWYALGLIQWATESTAQVQAAMGVRMQGVWYRCSSMLECAHGVTATMNCAYDVSSRKWFEIAGDECSLICDDFTRPWNGKPARFWIHDRTGKATSEEFEGNQEAQLLQYFADHVAEPDAFETNNRLALATQRLCDEVDRQTQTRD